MRKPKILAPPRTIFLQAGEIEEDARFSELAEGDNVTWCMDKQFDTDVEYRLVEDYQVEVRRLNQANYRLTMRCWAMAHLLYPQGNAPREAVEGDI